MGLREIQRAATPGPWGWFGNIKHGGPYLATRHGGRVFVMQFARLGMQDAQPVFQARDEDGRSQGMVEGRDLAIYEADHRDDITGFDNPDARFIATFDPEVVGALLDVAEAAGHAATETWSHHDFMHRMADLRAALDRLGEVAP